MTFDPGRVRLTLLVHEGLVSKASVACERPAVARLLRGKAAEQAVALVPLIYSLCGKAQGSAARAALSAARGQPVAAHVDARALAEAAREHAWALFVDWPRRFHLTPDEPFFVGLLRADAKGRRRLVTGVATHPLVVALREALRGGETIDKLLLERLEARVDCVRRWLAGEVQELGTVIATTVAAATGEARVATARGPLLHRLTLDGERIGDYRITAPTDIQFGPDGPVARWLGTLAGRPPDEAGRLARRLALAFDPCVPWECATA